ncbi:lymphotoxin beta [Rhinolophus ferrumequinum]|uniref:Lymphotoxin-beta n=1 Tax=Rhinolophus ferrumequinum TaxID=59479 RepID=A0A7J7YSL6_RHIFE|nr:lymphotoxin beta [Rhinolophus ferrumequinum]
MGALGLEGWGRRHQGKGCLLLAVAGATSLVTLLLAVPITVLAVLAVVPQEQGGLVTGTTEPGAQAQAQQRLGKSRPSPLQGSRRSGTPSSHSSASLDTVLLPVSRNPVSRPWALAPCPLRGPCMGGGPDPLVDSSPIPGFQELPEQDAETDPSPKLPAAHLIGAWTQGQGLGWETKKEEAFLRSGTQFSRAEGLALPRDGLYYLYCHVGYRGRAPPADGDPLGRSVTLRSRLYRAGGAYGPGTPELLLEGAETVSPALDPARRLWYTSVGFGGLVQLRRGERVYVNISHPDMVDYRRGKTFFGAVMVG